MKYINLMRLSGDSALVKKDEIEYIDMPTNLLISFHLKNHEVYTASFNTLESACSAFSELWEILENE